MKILLKRDETSLGFPGPDQVSIGELVLNSKTGKLYSKLTDGSIIEWSGKVVCPSNILATDAKLYYKSTLVNTNIISNFCSSGDALEFELLPIIDNFTDYAFEFVELTNNTSVDNIVISTPIYGTYVDDSVTKSKVSVRVSVTVPSPQQSTSIFKFSVLRTDTDQKIIEKLITIQCI
jgi:hypothetical protein